MEHPQAPCPKLPDTYPSKLSTEKVCKHLCINRPTLHRYVKQHHLNPKRLPGGQLRFLQEEVESLLT
ncbi:helix-turn-helix domain-containing protein [Prosthecobacter vanneervenii]|uniref:helix-turn-helix domain-containing protein n=1 Tax=Prosthecobacter vanneervenii TaxID=48466 RepID=UPI0038B57D5C